MYAQEENTVYVVVVKDRTVEHASGGGKFNNNIDMLILFSSGMSLGVTDLAEIDKDYVPGLMCIRDMEREAFEAMEMPFSTPSASGQEVQLHNKINRITLDNREEYVRLALHYRLHEFDLQVFNSLDNCSLVSKGP